MGANGNVKRAVCFLGLHQRARWVPRLALAAPFLQKGEEPNVPPMLPLWLMPRRLLRGAVS